MPCSRCSASEAAAGFSAGAYLARLKHATECIEYDSWAFQASEIMNHN